VRTRTTTKKSTRKAGIAKSPPKQRDPRVTAYIENAPEYARPILSRLRELVHEGCPEVVETIKWSMHSFEYRGMFAGMAAFKAHCVFGLWKHELIVASDPKALEAMGSFGCLRGLGDLPPRATMLRYVKQAKKLNDEGVKSPRTKTARKLPSAMHPEFAAALDRNAKAKKALAGFSPSQQREYTEWITDAKRDETRERRTETAIEWLSEGKTRHWKYARR